MSLLEYIATFHIYIVPLVGWRWVTIYAFDARLFADSFELRTKDFEPISGVLYRNKEHISCILHNVMCNIQRLSIIIWVVMSPGYFAVWMRLLVVRGHQRIGDQ
ncbi:hypothetical protein BLOT_007765 [Blomia tropicalis]|nr:hypothetical protein BLOT_007765 [Blomia tropicalis]